jgi:outer membrane protein
MTISRRTLATICLMTAAMYGGESIRGQEFQRLPIATDAGLAEVVEAGPPEEIASSGDETLQDAWAIALGGDPELEASRWQSSAAQRGLRAAEAERFPSITARGSYSVFDNPLTINAPLDPILPGATASVTANQREFFLGGVQVRQPLYTSGRVSYGIDAAGAEVNAAVANEARTELDVKLQVGEAYIGVLKAQRLLDVADGSVKSLESHTREVENLLKEGVGIPNNLLASRVALANAKQRQLQMKNIVAVAKAAYNRVLQRPLDTPVSLSDLPQPTDEYDLHRAIQQAVDGRPEIAQLSAKVRALRSQGAAVRAGYRPQVVVEGGFDYIENRFLDNETFNHVSVIAEWNFFDAGRKRHKVMQIEQSAEAVLRKRSNAESLIALQVNKAWHDLSTASQQVKVSKGALESATENLRVSRNRYKAGAGTNTEVLDAETLRTTAFSGYYKSLYNTVLAEIRLLRAIGSL